MNQVREGNSSTVVIVIVTGCCTAGGGIVFLLDRFGFVFVFRFGTAYGFAIVFGFGSGDTTFGFEISYQRS